MPVSNSALKVSLLSCVVWTSVVITNNMKRDSFISLKSLVVYLVHEPGN